jgi:hypothetical protein
MIPSLSNTLAGRSAHDPEGNLYLLIYEFNIPSVIIHCITSADNGNTWGSRVRLTEPGAGASSAKILVDDDGNLHFCYQGNETGKTQVYYRRKLANENEWQDKQMISVPSSQDYGKLYPSIATSNGNIFLFWNKRNKNGTLPFMFAHSPDSGSSWSTPMKIGKFGDGFNLCGQPHISDTGTILFIYQSMVGLKSEINFSSSSNSGSTWSDPVRLSNGSGKSYQARLLYPGKGQNISVVWTYVDTGSPSSPVSVLPEEFFYQPADSCPYLENYNSDISTMSSLKLQMVSSGNLGGNWNGISNIHTMTFFKNPNSIVTCTANCDSAGNFNLAWFDGPNENKFKVYFMRSIDNGTTWSTPKQVWGRADVKSTILSVDSLGNLYLSMFEGLIPYSITAYFTKSTQ